MHTTISSHGGSRYRLTILFFLLRIRDPRSAAANGGTGDLSQTRLVAQVLLQFGQGPELDADHDPRCRCLSPGQFRLQAWTSDRKQYPACYRCFHDGLFTPAPITVTFGTVSMILALLLLTRFVLTQQRKYLYATGLAAAVSGICHPFEVFSIVAATALTLAVTSRGVWRNAFVNSLCVAVPGLGSVLPYAYFSLTVPWMKEVSNVNRERGGARQNQHCNTMS